MRANRPVSARRSVPRMPKLWNRCEMRNARRQPGEVIAVLCRKRRTWWPVLTLGLLLLFLLATSGCSTRSAPNRLPPATLLVKCPERPGWPEKATSVSDVLRAIPEREAMWAACIRYQRRLVDWHMKEHGQ